MHNGKKPLALRVCSWLLIFVFAAGQVLPADSAWAAARIPRDAGITTSVFPALQIMGSLPESLGSLKDFIHAEPEGLSSGSLPAVLLVQDAHAQPEAQVRIMELLQFVHDRAREERIPFLIGVEGAGGAIHPEYFDFFPDYPGAGDAVVRSLLEKGEVSGPEFFAWESYKKEKQGQASAAAVPRPPVFGLEDAGIYRENLFSYRRLLSSREKIDSLLKGLRKEWHKEASHHMNPELAGFLRERERRKQGMFGLERRKGETDFGAYLRYLAQMAEKHIGLSLSDPIEQLRFPQTVRLISLGQTEQQMQREQASSEWRKLLARIGKDPEAEGLASALSAAGSRYGFLDSGQDTGLSSRTAYDGDYRRLAENLAAYGQGRAMDWRDYPQFWLAMRLIVLQSELQAEELFQEVERIESILGYRLAVELAEKELLEQLRNLDRLEKFLHLELTHGEYEDLPEDGPAGWKLPGTGNADDARFLEKFAAEAARFYEGALRRDQVFVEQALEKVRNAVPDERPGEEDRQVPLLVIVAGGFHASGIMDILAERGIPHASFMPRMTGTDGGERYRKVMLNANADLSVYFDRKNPFGTRQEALLFREVMESAVPYLYTAGLGREAVLEKLKTAVETHPVLSGILTVRVSSQDPPELTFESRPSAGLPAEAAISAPLVSGETGFMRRVEGRPVERARYAWKASSIRRAREGVFPAAKSELRTHEFSFDASMADPLEPKIDSFMKRLDLKGQWPRGEEAQAAMQQRVIEYLLRNDDDYLKGIMTNIWQEEFPAESFDAAAFRKETGRVEIRFLTRGMTKDIHVVTLHRKDGKSYAFAVKPTQDTISEEDAAALSHVLFTRRSAPHSGVVRFGAERSVLFESWFVSTYIAEEFVPGRTLDEVLKKGGLSEDDRTAAAKTAVQAFMNGPFLADPKPDNIVLIEGGDFRNPGHWRIIDADKPFVFSESLRRRGLSLQQAYREKLAAYFSDELAGIERRPEDVVPLTVDNESLLFRAAGKYSDLENNGLTVPSDAPVEVMLKITTNYEEGVNHQVFGRLLLLGPEGRTAEEIPMKIGNIGWKGRQEGVYMETDYTLTGTVPAGFSGAFRMQYTVDMGQTWKEVPGGGLNYELSRAELREKLPPLVFSFDDPASRDFAPLIFFDESSFVRGNRVSLDLDKGNEALVYQQFIEHLFRTDDEFLSQALTRLSEGFDPAAGMAEFRTGVREVEIGLAGTGATKDVYRVRMTPAEGKDIIFSVKVATYRGGNEGDRLALQARLNGRNWAKRSFKFGTGPYPKERTFYAEAFIEGPTLSEILEDGSLDPDYKERALRNAAQAFANGPMILDPKPDNIVAVGGDIDQWKIIDTDRNLPYTTPRAKYLRMLADYYGRDRVGLESEEEEALKPYEFKFLRPANPSFTINKRYKALEGQSITAGAGDEVEIEWKIETAYDTVGAGKMDQVMARVRFEGREEPVGMVRTRGGPAWETDEGFQAIQFFFEAVLPEDAQGTFVIEYSGDSGATWVPHTKSGPPPLVLNRSELRRRFAFNEPAGESWQHRVEEGELVSEENLFDAAVPLKVIEYLLRSDDEYVRKIMTRLWPGSFGDDFNAASFRESAADGEIEQMTEGGLKAFYRVRISMRDGGDHTFAVRMLSPSAMESGDWQSLTEALRSLEGEPSAEDYLQYGAQAGIRYGEEESIFLAEQFISGRTLASFLAGSQEDDRKTRTLLTALDEFRKHPVQHPLPENIVAADAYFNKWKVIDRTPFRPSAGQEAQGLTPEESFDQVLAAHYGHQAAGVDLPEKPGEPSLAIVSLEGFSMKELRDEVFREGNVFKANGYKPKTLSLAVTARLGPDQAYPVQVRLVPEEGSPVPAAVTQLAAVLEDGTRVLRNLASISLPGEFEGRFTLQYSPDRGKTWAVFPVDGHENLELMNLDMRLREFRFGEAPLSPLGRAADREGREGVYFDNLMMTEKYVPVLHGVIEDWLRHDDRLLSETLRALWPEQFPEDFDARAFRASPETGAVKVEFMGSLSDERLALTHDFRVSLRHAGRDFVFRIRIQKLSSDKRETERFGKAMQFALADSSGLVSAVPFTGELNAVNSFGTMDVRRFIVQEEVQGESLDDLSQREGIPEEEKRDILRRGMEFFRQAPPVGNPQPGLIAARGGNLSDLVISDALQQPYEGVDIRLGEVPYEDSIKNNFVRLLPGLIPYEVRTFSFAEAPSSDSGFIERIPGKEDEYYSSRKPPYGIPGQLFLQELIEFLLRSDDAYLADILKNLWPEDYGEEFDAAALRAQVRNVTIAYVASGATKHVFRVSLNMNDGREHVFSVKTTHQMTEDDKNALLNQLYSRIRNPRSGPLVFGAARDFYFNREQTDYSIFIAEEFIPGRTLEDVLTDESLSDEQKKAAVEAAVEAFRKVWLNDPKPENIVAVNGDLTKWRVVDADKPFVFTHSHERRQLTREQAYDHLLRSYYKKYIGDVERSEADVVPLDVQEVRSLVIEQTAGRITPQEGVFTAPAGTGLPLGFSLKTDHKTDTSFQIAARVVSPEGAVIAPMRYSGMIDEGRTDAYTASVHFIRGQLPADFEGAFRVQYSVDMGKTWADFEEGGVSLYTVRRSELRAHEFSFDRPMERPWEHRLEQNFPVGAESPGAEPEDFGPVYQRMIEHFLRNDDDFLEGILSAIWPGEFAPVDAGSFRARVDRVGVEYFTSGGTKHVFLVSFQMQDGGVYRFSVKPTKTSIAEEDYYDVIRQRSSARGLRRGPDRTVYFEYRGNPFASRTTLITEQFAEGRTLADIMRDESIPEARRNEIVRTAIANFPPIADPYPDNILAADGSFTRWIVIDSDKPFRPQDYGLGHLPLMEAWKEHLAGIYGYEAVGIRPPGEVVQPIDFKGFEFFATVRRGGNVSMGFKNEFALNPGDTAVIQVSLKMDTALRKPSAQIKARFRTGSEEEGFRYIPMEFRETLWNNTQQLEGGISEEGVYIVEYSLDGGRSWQEARTGPEHEFRVTRTAALSELREGPEEQAEQDSTLKISRYIANLIEQGLSLDGLTLAPAVPDGTEEALLSVTELIGLLGRDPELAWKARAFLIEPAHAPLVSALEGVLRRKLDGKKTAAEDADVLKALREAGQETLAVLLEAIRGSNAGSLVRRREELPLTIHFNAEALERHFTGLGRLPQPLAGEAPVTDLWFIYDPVSVLGLVATHRHEGMPAHAKGGIRYIHPLGREQQYDHHRLYTSLFQDPLGRNPSLKGVIVDLFDLVRSQQDKNILGTKFEGAKAEYTFLPGSSDEKAFKKFAAALIDAGILAHEVPGPDIGMSGDKVQAGINEARRTLFRHFALELEILGFIASDEAVGAGKLSEYGLSQDQLASIRREFRETFPEIRDPVLAYEEALQIVEGNSSVRFLFDRVARLARMEVVRDYWKGRLDLSGLETDLQLFDSTNHLAAAFYKEIKIRALGDPELAGAVFQANYRPSSPALEAAVRKALGAVITGGRVSEGANDHVVSAITAKGVDVAYRRVKDFLAARDPQLAGRPLRLAYNGAGDVGGSAALMAARGGDLVVLIQDVNGAVYKKDGFSVEALQAFNNIPPSQRNVAQFFGNIPGAQSMDREAFFSGKKEWGIDVIVTAATANTINETNVDQVIRSGVKAVVEGGNNTFKRVAARLASAGVITAPGPTANTGGVIASGREDEDKHTYTVEQITRPRIVTEDGREFVAALDGHEERVPLLRGAKKAAGYIRLRDGQVIEAIKAFGDLPVGTYVDVMKTGEGETVHLEAFVNNIKVGEVDKSRKYTQWIRFPVNGGYTFVVVENGSIIEANPALPGLQPGPVDVLYPVRERKYRTYRYVEDTIFAFQTLVLALQEPGNPERDGARVQRALSRALVEKKAEIYGSPAYAEAREEEIRKLKESGYVATPEEMRHLVSAELARRELVGTVKDDQGRITAVTTVNPFTGEPVQVSRDFVISPADAGEDAGRSELRSENELYPYFGEETLGVRKRLDVYHDQVTALARGEDGNFIIGLYHQGTFAAADINFHPNDARQGGNGLGEFDEESIYELTEIFSNHNEAVSEESPGDRIILTGREITYLGMGAHDPLPIGGQRVYRFRKIQEGLPGKEQAEYRALLQDSLRRYKKYGPKDRFEHSFISREIVASLETPESGERYFPRLFRMLSEMIESDPKLRISDLTTVFGDLLTYAPELREALNEELITLAVRSRWSNAFTSETAVKVLRSAEIGEVVLSSPETLWSAGSGGLGVAVSDLARELAALGIPVSVVTPAFTVDKPAIFSKYNPMDTGRTIRIRFGARGEELETLKIYEAYIEGVRVLYLENDRYFNRLKGEAGQGSAYHGFNPDRLRFIRMLSLGTLGAIRERNIHAKVVQVNDWATGFVKAYLEGRERVDPDFQNLRSDPHLAETKVHAIQHNLQFKYQGKVHAETTEERDALVRNHTGMDPYQDGDVLFREGEWNVINPVYAEIKTADISSTVGGGYHARSLDMRYDDEFGNLVPLLQWKNNLGHYQSLPNGFGVVSRQKKFMEKLLNDPEVRKRMLRDLEDKDWKAANADFAGFLEKVYEKPGAFARSFLEMGREAEKRLLARVVFDYIQPVQKTRLQKMADLPVDESKFVFGMIHRIDEQKGHQLMLADIWHKDRPRELRLQPGQMYEDPEIVQEITEEEALRLSEFAEAHGKTTLRSLEIAAILMPQAQFVIAGAAEPDGWYDRGFSEVAAAFPQQVYYYGKFVKADSVLYELIYTGSTRFGMPSFFEPGGLSNVEAAGHGVLRHITRRDGLVDGEIRTADFEEAFDSFNPVSWFKSLYQGHYRFYLNEPEKENEHRYLAITQDNRWLIRARGYLDTYYRLAGADAPDELHALEVAAAIHRAGMKKHPDPADELMEAGFAVPEAVQYLIESLTESTNEVLVGVIASSFLADLAKVSPQVKTEIQETLTELLDSPGLASVHPRLKTALEAVGRSELRGAGEAALADDPADFSPTGAFADRMRRNAIDGDFLNAPDFNSGVQEQVLTAAEQIGRIFRLEDIAGRLPSEVVIGGEGGPGLRLDRRSAAMRWAAREILILSGAFDTFVIENKDLQSLVDSILAQAGSAALRQETAETGPAIHVHIQELPENPAVLVPVIAAVAATGGKLFLNPDGLDEAAAARAEASILEAAKIQGLTVPQGRFRVLADTGQQTFESLPSSRLEGEQAVLGEDALVQNVSWRKNLARFKYDAGLALQAEILGAYILSSLKAMALDRVWDTPGIYDPSVLDPDSFDFIVTALQTYLAAQAEISAAA